MAGGSLFSCPLWFTLCGFTHTLCPLTPQLIFADEYDEFNAYVAENIDRITKRAPKEVRVCTPPLQPTSVCSPLTPLASLTKPPSLLPL